MQSSSEVTWVWLLPLKTEIQLRDIPALKLAAVLFHKMLSLKQSRKPYSVISAMDQEDLHTHKSSEQKTHMGEGQQK